MKANPCKWVLWDAEGRPRCEHGWARKAGAGKWRCRVKHDAANDRYLSTEAGAAKRAASNYEWNHSLNSRSSTALYELTRVRVG